MTPRQMFPRNVPRILKIDARVSVVESLFSKVIREISTFHNSFENLITRIGILQKLALKEISINSLLTCAAALQSTIREVSGKKN